MGPLSGIFFQKNSNFSSFVYFFPLIFQKIEKLTIFLCECLPSYSSTICLFLLFKISDSHPLQVVTHTDKGQREKILFLQQGDESKDSPKTDPGNGKSKNNTITPVKKPLTKGKGEREKTRIELLSSEEEEMPSKKETPSRGKGTKRKRKGDEEDEDYDEAQVSKKQKGTTPTRSRTKKVQPEPEKSKKTKEPPPKEDARLVKEKVETEKKIVVKVVRGKTGAKVAPARKVFAFCGLQPEEKLGLDKGSLNLIILRKFGFFLNFLGFSLF